MSKTLGGTACGDPRHHLVSHIILDAEWPFEAYEGPSIALPMNAREIYPVGSWSQDAILAHYARPGSFEVVVAVQWLYQCQRENRLVGWREDEPDQGGWQIHAHFDPDFAWPVANNEGDRDDDHNGGNSEHDGEGEEVEDEEEGCYDEEEYDDDNEEEDEEDDDEEDDEEDDEDEDGYDE
ncbi:uncharacterized protein LOC62_04G006187 [Vanrija pseudolonga]|uniref:Uncharacterized protein n=1 Tax=Vanrija pseudolonga TaxID=143232 RepID=A0AAF0YFR0_9TREE|nr:hypothetical protein LOC62_04G006187 [Vanrija pseudolonga]